MLPLHPPSNTPTSHKQQHSLLTHPPFQSKENSTSESSLGKTHAKDNGNDSIVPKVIQKLVPESLERALPDSIHNTGDSVTHAKQGGEDSVVPKAAQKAVPEGVERALPDSVHNTGDSKR